MPRLRLVHSASARKAGTMTETTAGPGRWMKVTFWGYLPEGMELFEGRESASLDVTTTLMSEFGFSGLAHLTVSDGARAQAEIREALGTLDLPPDR